MRTRFLWLVPSVVLLACGSRSALHVAEDKAERTPVECWSDSDCAIAEDKCTLVACREGTCSILGAVSCDDGDACTADSCDPATGECRNEPLTQDLDGDGYRAPLPGFRAGEPGACGDDCDDSNPNAYPGHAEVCDGIDNDCNGVVDDGKTYVPSGEEPILVSDGRAPAMPGGLAFANGRYLAAYTGYDAGMYSAYATPIDASVGVASKLVEPPYHGEAGPPAWAGDRFGMAYYRRTPYGGNYLAGHEVRFTLSSSDGEKTGPDVRIHTAFAHLNSPPVTVFTGNEFVVTWAHREGSSGVLDFHVYAQRVDRDGNLVGPKTIISLLPGDDPWSKEGTVTDDSEAPQVAVGRHGLGFVWVRTRMARPAILFRSFDFELQPLMDEPVVLTPTDSFGGFPTIAYDDASETHLVAWHDPNATPHAIYGAAVAEDGTVVIPTKPITESPRHSRYPSLVPLGDRTLLVFSDTKDQNQGYELYMKTLDADLTPVGPEIRLTDAPGDSVLPVTSFGPNGDIGILYRDNRSGQHHVYLSRLVCTAAGQP